MQARFGGGRMEKDVQRTSPAAYPTVLAAIRELHRLEHVGETLRHALNALAIAAPAWLRTNVDPVRASATAPASSSIACPKQTQSGPPSPEPSGRMAPPFSTAITATSHCRPTCEPCRRSRRCGRCGRSKTSRTRLGMGRCSACAPAPNNQHPPISSPDDPRARYRTKRETSWLGYTVHLTETCEDDLPNVITHVATTPSTTADCALTATIQADLATKELLPAEHYVDSGYVDAGILVESETEHGVTMVGPVSADYLASPHARWAHGGAICLRSGGRAGAVSGGQAE